MKKHSFDLFLISNLISKSLSGDLTMEEQEQLVKWLQDKPGNRRIFESYKDENALQADLQFMDSVDAESGWENITEKIQLENRTSGKSRLAILNGWFYKYKKLSIAAILFLISMAAVLTFQTNNDPGIVKDLSGQYKNDVLPGKNQAKLILSDGKVIDLQDQKEQFAEDDGALIKSINGSLNYFNTSDTTIENSKKEIYNTLLVPKGGAYQITLPDGTNVWLNSESELRFPVRFAGATRNVFLKGEAFFEVSKNAAKPFLVEIKGSTIEVLGTQFNINSYTNEVKTTLVEGSVKLSSSIGASAVLKPGQRGDINKGLIEIKNADMRKALAWKNGEFYFKGDRFTDILNQLALWYDLDIEMEKSMANISITGSIDKDVQLSEVLTMLKYITKGHFELSGRKLTVKRI